MPELPEVEIVKQSLSKKITLKKIQKIIIKNGNLRFKIAENFVRILKNSRIKKISRFSKYLIIFLDNNYYCIIHLGMSGTLHIVNKRKKNLLTNLSFYHSPNLPKKHNHVHIFFKRLFDYFYFWQFWHLLLYYLYKKIKYYGTVFTKSKRVSKKRF